MWDADSSVGALCRGATHPCRLSCLLTNPLACLPCLPACRLPVLCADKELREVWELLEQRYKMNKQ